ncbi:MAG TPA: 2-oxoglutarate dehydrogenase complex dihydrolipoyllysine-residue succinyltransferase [Thermoanaerobaculia bacterium]|nr:2-oxoglutarate dehydrogenase complex dihydrolipoyllysine-residue succinyltransferase [Thermoanaerobaculia bacterium]
MTVELTIPTVGESVTEAVITRWLKAEGDRVEKDEPIAELETDKVDVELPSPASGILASITAQEGESVPVGGVIGTIDDGAEAGDGEPSPEKEPPKKEPPRKEPPRKEPPERRPPRKEPPRREPPIEEPPRREPPPQAPPREEPPPMKEPPGEEPPPMRAERESPSLAAASGREPRTVEAEQGEEPREARSGTAPERREETVAMTPIRRRIAKRLVEAQLETALTTTFNEVDMGAVQELRREWRETFEARYDVRLGLMSFFVKAAVDALRRYPKFNARIKGDAIVYRDYCDVGIAVATERGLVVPVVRDAERLSFADIEQAIEDLARRARSGELEVDDLTGGTFTITNGGVFGSLLSVPLVNPPQTAVLGLHAIQERPVARDGQVVIRSMMYLALTYDHRLVDGAEAVTFLRRVKEVVEEPARLLLES